MTAENDIFAHLPEDLTPNEIKMLGRYSRVQERIRAGQKVRAKELMNHLQRVVGFKEFEDSHEPLFAAIDVAVRGSTNRKDELENFIEPSFRIKP